MSAMARGVEDGTLDPVDDVTERTMERCMHGAQFDDDDALDVRGLAGSEPTTNGGGRAIVGECLRRAKRRRRRRGANRGRRRWTC